MCGRFNLITSAQDIAQALGFKTQLKNIFRYNIAPSQQVCAVRYDDHGQFELTYFKWGLLPSWVKDPKKSPKPINAKSESAFEKPFFRSAFKKRRCLIPANGFYEWQSLSTGKQPFLIHFKNDRLFFFAGLWESWVAQDGEVLETCTILTTSANQVVSRVHLRMPVILPESAQKIWLKKDLQDSEKLCAILKPYEKEDELDIFPISTLVNNPRNDQAECLQPL